MNFRSLLFFLLASPCIFGIAYGQQPDCSPKSCAYLDTSLSPEARAKDLVHRMTVEEKISQTVDVAKPVPRLGIPGYNWWSEGLHGVARNGTATVFPQAIALGATWDPELVHSIAEIIATEARAKYNIAAKNGNVGRYAGLTYWSPNINIFRDPRWGRGQETYGEDPFLTATTGVAFIRGLQGDDPKHLKIVATPKHFAVHSGPEPGRHSFDVHPSPFDLEDTYLPAFRAAIVDGKAKSIMCAYNAVNGAPACSNQMLLQKVLRDNWKFSGFVVSDCDAVGDIYQGHHFAKDGAGASAVALAAGTDLDCGSTYKALGDALKQGQISEAQLDTTLVRLFAARIELGLFEKESESAYSTLSDKDVNMPESRGIALRAARESIVLLQNRTSLLPLKGNPKIAVVGPTAGLLQAIEGNYNGTTVKPVLPVEGIQKLFGIERVSYSPGAALADGISAPIPSTFLSPSASGKATGLNAEYFSNPTFAGQPALKRVDSMVNFNWESVSPSPDLPVKNFSVRWSGFIQFPSAGDYTLNFRGIPRAKKVVDVTGEGQKVYTGAATAVRVFLDDKLVVDSGAGQSSYHFSLPAAGPHAVRVEYARVGNERYISLEWVIPTGALLPDAIEKAKEADVVVAFVGLSPDLEGEQMSVHAAGFNGGDRTDIDLPAPQQQLLEEVKKTGKPLVVILTSGSAIAANWANEHAEALLEAWYGGEEASTAIAETLAGRSNPSGRLPITFYRDTKDLPAFTDYSMTNRTYRYFHGPVLYPFGYGLSYTTFQFEHSALSQTKIRAGESLTVSTTIRNVGARAGDEVAEVYIETPQDKGQAHPFLAGFKRVHLQAGESKKVSIDVDPRQLSRVKERGERVISEGDYNIYVGEGQPAYAKQPISLKLRIEGKIELPK